MTLIKELMGIGWCVGRSNDDLNYQPL